MDAEKQKTPALHYVLASAAILGCFVFVAVLVALALSKTSPTKKPKTRCELRFAQNNRTFNVLLLRGALPRETRIVELFAPPEQGLYYFAPSTQRFCCSAPKIYSTISKWCIARK
jgi:hypothetical protein